MAAQASRVRKLPAVNDSASFEIAYVTSASCARKRRNLRQSLWTQAESSHIPQTLQQTKLSERN
jgi:hypothetical protein